MLESGIKAGATLVRSDCTSQGSTHDAQGKLEYMRYDDKMCNKLGKEKKNEPLRFKYIYKKNIILFNFFLDFLLDRREMRMSYSLFPI